VRGRPTRRGRRAWDVNDHPSDRGNRLSYGTLHERREVLRCSGKKPGLQLRWSVRSGRRAQVPEAIRLQRRDADVLRDRRAKGHGSRHGRHLHARGGGDHVYGDDELPDKRYRGVFVGRGRASLL
jgi:hypothetical protein